MIEISEIETKYRHVILWAVYFYFFVKIIKLKLNS
jgi:hypothetical protein